MPEAQVETIEPATPSVSERLREDDQFAGADPASTMQALKGTVDPFNQNPPIIERKAGPELAKQLEDMPATKALRAAGKAYSDARKLERYKELGAPDDMTTADVSELERRIDDGSLGLQRNPVQPGNVNADRIIERGLSFDGVKIPRYDAIDSLDPGKPILKSRGGQLEGESLSVREAQLGAKEDRARMLAELARDAEVREAARLNNLFGEQQQAQPQAQPQQPQRQPQPQPQRQAQVDPVAQERARVAAQAQWNNLSAAERNTWEQAQQVRGYIQQLDNTVISNFTEYEMRTGDVTGDERAAAYQDLLDKKDQAVRALQQHAINGEYYQRQRVNQEGRIRDANTAARKQWSKGEDAKVSAFCDQMGLKGDYRNEVAAETQRILNERPQLKADYERYGDSRSADVRIPIIEAAIGRIAMRQKAQVMEKINTQNVRPSQPPIRPGNLNGGGANANDPQAEVRRLQAAMDAAPAGSRQQMMISAKLTQAMRRSGAIQKF